MCQHSLHHPDETFTCTCFAVTYIPKTLHTANSTNVQFVKNVHHVLGRSPYPSPAEESQLPSLMQIRCRGTAACMQDCRCRYAWQESTHDGGAEPCYDMYGIEGKMCIAKKRAKGAALEEC